VSLDSAIRMTEVLVALAFIQQSLEHLGARQDERRLHLPRLLACLPLLLGFAAPWACLALLAIGVMILRRFHGPYNGGADRMSLLVLCCLSLALFVPSERWRAVAFGYLAAQLTLSYFVSGWVKIVNPDWRSGIALRDVFSFSAYPVGENLRGLADHPGLLRVMSWAVMGFELLFPLLLITRPTLIAGLVVAATFHFANACLFGLNRFFWIWLTAYPSLLWFQERLFSLA
jgi:hypothetical protein